MQSAHGIEELRSHIQRLYKGQRIALSPYQYQVAVPTILDDGRATAFIKLLSNADFLALGAIFNGDFGGDTVKVLVSDTGSNQRWMQTEVFLVNWASWCNVTEQDFAYPQWLSGSTQVQFDFHAVGGAFAIADASLTLNGISIRKY